MLSNTASIRHHEFKNLNFSQIIFITVIIIQYIKYIRIIFH